MIRCAPFSRCVPEAGSARTCSTAIRTNRASGEWRGMCFRPAVPMETFVQDVAYAVRTLLKAPGFTGVATLTIALGIGACTAVFSVVNGVLLQPLPYSDPARLALIWSELRTRNVLDFPMPIPDLRDVRENSTTLETVAGFNAGGRVALSGDGGEAEQVRGGGATTNLFQVLGVRMALGRDFVDADGTPNAPQPPPAPGVTPAPGPPPLPIIAIISHDLWQRRYGADPSIVGRSIGFANTRAEVVGVLPPDFELLFPPRAGIGPDIDIWTAMRLNFDTAARSTGALRVVGRLKPGVTLAQAQTDMDAISADLRERFPTKKNVNLRLRIVGMHDDIVSGVRPLVLALFGAVAFVLLIACANVANLLLVRAAARQREFVIRAAIGGGRGRLIRQMLTETLLLAGVGGTAGVALGQAGVDLLASMAPPGLPRVDDIRVDGTVLAFSIGATLLTALVCGLVPAFRAARQNVAEIVRASTPGLRAGRRLRYGVVLAEVALSFVLLIGAGLMMRSFITLQNVDPGYDYEHVLTFLKPPQFPTPEQRANFMRQVEQRLLAVPGVEAVGAAAPMPLDGGDANIPWATEEAGSVDPSAFRQANFHVVTPGYFDALKARLIAGRTFTATDNVQGEASAKVVIDDMVAAQAFPEGNAVGRRILIRNLFNGNQPNAPQNVPLEVIGVVAHQRHQTLTEPGREGIFVVEGYTGFGVGRWAVRTSGDPARLAPSIAAAVAEIDNRAPIAEVQPMRALVDKVNGPTRFATTMIGLFGMVAIVLAAVGLYGVLATTVRQRTSEIGMRMVCGAQPQGILRLVLVEGLRLSVIGLAIGLAIALSLTNLIQSLLVGVTPTDPITYVGITLIFLSIATLAALVPALRAARLDPMLAIRHQ
jgi:putative ABC transport system permease protein